MAATDRVFVDLVSGVTDADPGVGGTTLSGPFLADLPEVADPEFVALTLDPEEENGEPEIVWVTAHTASATTATVLRAQEGTSARAHPSGTKAVAGFTATSIQELYDDVAAAVAALTSHGATHGTGGGDELPAGGVVLSMLATAVQNALNPAGSIQAYGGSSAPAGWLLCQGQEISRTTYADLFAVIGTTYGNGDGSTTFNVPDLRQRFPLGKAASGTGSTLGATGGAIDHTHTGPSHSHSIPAHSHTMPSHTHSFSDTSSSNGAHTHALGTSSGATVGATHGSDATAGLRSYNDSVQHDHSFSDTSSSAGSHAHTDPATSSSHTGSEGPHSHFSGGSTSSNGAHTHSVSGTTGLGSGTSSTFRSKEHTHALGTSGSSGAHTHTVSGTTGSTDPGDTNSGGSGSTGASGTGSTGSANPPFLVVNYIIKT